MFIEYLLLKHLCVPGVNPAQSQELVPNGLFPSRSDQIPDSGCQQPFAASLKQRGKKKRKVFLPGQVKAGQGRLADSWTAESWNYNRRCP